MQDISLDNQANTNETVDGYSSKALPSEDSDDFHFPYCLQKIRINRNGDILSEIYSNWSTSLVAKILLCNWSTSLVAKIMLCNWKVNNVTTDKCTETGVCLYGCCGSL
jgi:hypothetical protein